MVGANWDFRDPNSGDMFHGFVKRAHGIEDKYSTFICAAFLLGMAF